MVETEGLAVAPPRAPRRRQAGPKVKTGCGTCKIRRVKCDEAKPICMRCVRGQFVCDGSPPAQMFKTDQEYRCFQRFCTQTAFQLAGFRETQLWSRIVLQASEAEPCIMHAVTALGGLKLTERPNKGKDIESPQLEFAYREYGKAIVGLKRSIQTGKSDTRTKLIASLLFTCFEAYHENNETANRQVVAGLCLLEAYSKNRNKPIKAQSETGPSPIEEELVEAFAILEIQHAFQSGYQNTLNTHHERLHDSQKFTDNIPAEFSTLRDAEFMLTMVVLRPVHLRITVGQYQNNTPTNMTVAEIRRDQDKFKQWNTAFAPLLKRSRLNRGSDSYKRATLLQFHYLASFLWASSALPLDQWYRKHTTELEECVKLAKVIITFRKPTPFSLDFQIVHPLLGLGFSYRHRRLRKEIADMFFEMKQQEKIWNTVMMAKIFYWMAEIEEVGLGDENEYVPEHMFCNIVKWEFNEMKRSVCVACKAEYSGLEESPLMETIICW